VGLAPQSASVLRGFADFLLELKNDPTRGLELLADAEQIEDEQSRTHGGVGADASEVLLGAPAPGFDLSGESVALLRVTAEGERAGLMTHANAAALKLFGYSQRELVGRDMKAIIPEPIAGVHDRFMGAFLRDGRERITGASVVLFGLHKAGHIMPMRANIHALGSEWALVCEEVPTQLGFVWCLGASAGWRLQAACRASMTLLGIDAAGMKAGALALEDVIAGDVAAAVGAMADGNGASVPIALRAAGGVATVGSSPGAADEPTLLPASVYAQTINLTGLPTPLYMLRWRRAGKGGAAGLAGTPHAAMAEGAYGGDEASSEAGSAARAIAHAMASATWANSPHAHGRGGTPPASGVCPVMGSSAARLSRALPVHPFSPLPAAEGSANPDVFGGLGSADKPDAAVSSANTVQNDGAVLTFHARPDRGRSLTSGRSDSGAVDTLVCGLGNVVHPEGAEVQAERQLTSQSSGAALALPGILRGGSQRMGVQHWQQGLRGPDSGSARVSSKRVPAHSVGPVASTRASTYDDASSQGLTRRTDASSGGNERSSSPSRARATVGWAASSGGVYQATDVTSHAAPPPEVAVDVITDGTTESDAAILPAVGVDGGAMPLSPGGKAGSVHSKSSCGSGGSALSLSEVLRRGVAARGGRLERSLVLLKRCILVVFALTALMNFVSLAVSHVLFGQMAANLELVRLNGVRSVLLQRSYTDTQRLVLAAEGNLALEDDGQAVKERLRRELDVLEAVHQGLYMAVDGSMAAETALYTRPVVPLQDLVPGTYRSRGRYNVTTRSTNLVVAGLEFITKARQLSYAPLANITMDRPEAFFVVQTGFTLVKDAMNSSMFSAHGRSADQAQTVTQTNLVLTVTALAVYLLAGMAVIAPAVLRVTADKRAIYDVLLQVPVAVVRALRARSQRAVDAARKQGAGGDDGDEFADADGGGAEGFDGGDGGSDGGDGGGRGDLQLGASASGGRRISACGTQLAGAGVLSNDDAGLTAALDVMRRKAARAARASVAAVSLGRATSGPVPQKPGRRYRNAAASRLRILAMMLWPVAAAAHPGHDAVARGGVLRLLCRHVCVAT
jgi:PAS domain S-box-containing protein